MTSAQLSFYSIKLATPTLRRNARGASRPDIISCAMLTVEIKFQDVGYIT